MDQYIGKMLDNRYEILECIGVGGMAMVYKSRDHRLNRLVAIKILKPELASDAEFRRRFHDESQAVAMLSHVNIVAIYDVSRSEELDYIVMELVDGMTLKQYMKKRGTPLSWREALHFITQIVRALGHAHSRGIIHRDIKPQNIMVLRDGSVKVTDFGIARVASAAQATLTQEALGSVHYISPEQARGSHIDGRSDLYSAGVVLYEMLTGRLPFEGETPVSVAIQHINSIPIPPRDLNPDIPPALEAITLKAMSPKPEDRYSSADEMLADLEEFRKNPDVTPEHARRDDDALMEEPTRVVPVSEIRQEEAQQRVRRADPDPDRDRAVERQARRSARVERTADKDDYDDYDEEPRRRGVPPFLIAILAILVFVGGLIFFAYNFFLRGMFTQEGSQLRVPNLTPYTYSELQADPSLYEGFTIEVVEQRTSNDYAKGAVIEQDPVADTLIPEGESTVIQLVICAGAEPITMPNVVGELYVNVTSELRAMDLTVEIEYENSEEVDSDLIIRTTPEAGTELSPGDTVILYVSQGKESDLVIVPDFLNMTLDDARDAATSAGLTIGTVDSFPSKDYEAGRISYQSIAAYKDVERGTTINLWVSTGSGEEEPSPSPSESLPPTTSEDPTGSASPDPGPSDTMAVSTTKTITVDLRDFDGPKVDLRVVVGGSVVFSGTVNTSIGTQNIPVTGTGSELVEIYDGDTLVGSYYLDFSE